MALMTKTRSENALSTWESIFPNPTLGPQQSSVFVKKLLAIAVSNITYLRTIFPEGAFGDKKLDNMNLKVLKEDGKCPGAFQLIQWVKGCFDALDRKYLRAIVLGIYLDPTDCQTAIETYTFRFSYTETPGIDIYRNERKIASRSRASHGDDVKRATIKLLRSILVLTQTLDPLPNDVYMAIKLFYLDDVTPADYNPSGFEASSAGDFCFREEAFLIDAGHVETPFHDIQMRVKALSSNFDDSQIESADTPATENIHQPPASNMENTMDMSSRSQQGCPCGIEEETGLMLVCAVCSARQHAVCFGILDTAASIRHVCEKCADAAHPSTDPQLAGMGRGELKSLCLWRQCLSCCSAMSTITQHTLTRKMQVSPAEAGDLIQRLRSEELICSVSKCKKPVRFSPTPLLRSTGLVKYFLAANKQLGERRVLRDITTADPNKLPKRKLCSDTTMETDVSDLKRKASRCEDPISTARL